MSYCVNCGVELEADRKKCPLCGVKVINPAQPTNEESKSYPKERDVFQKKDRLFWIKFISIVLIVPIATCVMSDLLLTKQLTWSIYVIAGVLMAWALSTSPLYFRRFRVEKMLLIDITAVIVCLLIIEHQAPGSGWVLRIALPVAAFVLFSGLIIASFFKHLRLSGLGVAAGLFIAAGIMMPGLEALIDLYNSIPFSLFWSWFVSIPCLSVAALLIFLNNNKSFKAELQKRLHF